MTNTSNIAKVFISYAKGDNTKAGLLRKKVLVHLYKSLKAKGYNVVVDFDIAYKESISDFMNKMGYGNYVILIISDAYLKSKRNMAEVLEITKYPNFKERIFPIVLSDAKIYDSLGILEYLNHWDNEVTKLENAINRLSNKAYATSIYKEIDLYNEVRRILDGFGSTINDMNVLKPEIHSNTNFKSLFKVLDVKIKQDKRAYIKEFKEKKEKNNKKKGINAFVFLGFLASVILAVVLYFNLSAHILISSDTNCEIQINNDRIYRLKKGIAKKISLKNGNYYIVAWINQTNINMELIYL